MENDLASGLASAALCRTSHPADAVAALMVAATTILSARLDPPAIVAVIRAATDDALALSQPAGRA